LAFSKMSLYIFHSPYVFKAKIIYANSAK